MEVAKLNFQYPAFCYALDKLNLDKRLMKHEFDEVLFVNIKFFSGKFIYFLFGLSVS